MSRAARRLLAAVPLVLWASAGNAVAAPSPSAPTGSPPDTIAARAQGCATCHGKAGQGTPDEYFPRIAGKPQGYLFNQLQSFREGRRSYPPMNYLLAYLHDDYLREMAQFFSTQQLPFAAPEVAKATQAQLTQGESLVRHGDSVRGVPACSACHGPQLMGMNPGIPGLIGLHSRYISAQLEAWRAGTRRALKPDCMHEIATHLSEEQISAVAAWLATQAPPGRPEPAPPGKWKLPLVCGSEPG
jgi:cytochrome c553